MEKRVSEAVIRRLPRYYRYLKMLQGMGVERISSKSLGEIMETTASQIRQDFNCFGGFGQQGYGYHVGELKNRIAEIIGLNKGYQIIVVGAGNIGQALAGYRAFLQEGYEITALFDNDPHVVGGSVGDIPVLPMDDLERFIQRNRVDIAILTVPEQHAKAAAQLLCDAGIRAIWNFAPVDITLENLVCENVQLTDGLMALTYKLNAANGQ
ncbi:MAG: redox-sensing transcriptional repressor Rex [Eubacteriales bacterium]|nr:redox-sensing transcriptional repressor Rex [Eubacteriales bacterium]